MPQSGSDSLRSSSPADSVLITRQLALPPDVDSVPDVPDEWCSDDHPPVDRGRGSELWEPLDKCRTWDGDVRFSVSQLLAMDNNCDVGGRAAAAGASPAKARVPFQKWVQTLRRRGLERMNIPQENPTHPSKRPQQLPDGPQLLLGRWNHHRRSSSESSFAFVSRAKSASVSVASASIIGRSRRTTAHSSRGHARTDRSSRASVSGTRFSEDSHLQGPVPAPLDPGVVERALQRRRVLEELISTEENYIGDVRFLSNVYVTLLASLPTSQAGLRASINRNLNDIVQFHEELLGELHQVVPDSEYTQLEQLCSLREPRAPIHHRWRSLDAVPENSGDMSHLFQMPGMAIDPTTAAMVADVFVRKMNRFFIYEEYGAKYELMIKDIAVAQRTMPQWDRYQKGLEALASSVCSTNSSGCQAKKALTIGDLLVKPIQRVCKYPLLFAELLKSTPVCDCPYSYLEIEGALARLREATGAINRATDDPRAKATIEKTWLLQDRLVFPNHNPSAASKSIIRSFGHIQLCGVLHVCWQTKESVNGSYMVCLLYREWLCLAFATKMDLLYTIQACLSLSNISVEEVDNGRGLQCHTAPFSWKLVFECDHQLYEIIMTACTPKEEMEWRSRLSLQPAVYGHHQAEAPLLGSLSLNIKTLGAVYGKPGSIARRISIHRATTVGPKSPLCQVILKNTSVEKDTSTVASKSSINRSQSLLTTHSRTPVLAPSQGERARLEALLSDVWTREVLPFPGMTVRARSEHLVRSSATSVMRKLSVTSITSSFTKRSSSLASMHMTSSSDEPAATSSSSEGCRGLAPRAKQDCADVDVLFAAVEHVQSRLSIISDETGRRSARAGPIRAEEGGKGEAETVAAVRRVETLRMESDWQDDGGAAAAAAATPTPPPSPSADTVRSACRRTFSRGPRKPRADSPPKDSSPQSSCKTASLKSMGRWTRVGGFHRGIMVQGIRNFFR